VTLNEEMDATCDHTLKFRSVPNGLNIAENWHLFGGACYLAHMFYNNIY
jgi:hypothetical protein